MIGSTMGRPGWDTRRQPRQLMVLTVVSLFGFSRQGSEISSPLNVLNYGMIFLLQSNHADLQNLNKNAKNMSTMPTPTAESLCHASVSVWFLYQITLLLTSLVCNLLLVLYSLTRYIVNQSLDYPCYRALRIQNEIKRYN